MIRVFWGRNVLDLFSNYECSSKGAKSQFFDHRSTKKDVPISLYRRGGIALLSPYAPAATYRGGGGGV